MVAVLPEFRNQGLGRLLLEHLFKEAAKIYIRLSLSVEADNPAIALFEELGFEKLEGSEHSGINGTSAYKMVKTLEKMAEEEEKKSLEEERFRKSFGF